MIGSKSHPLRGRSLHHSQNWNFPRMLSFIFFFATMCTKLSLQNCLNHPSPDESLCAKELLGGAEFGSAHWSLKLTSHWHFCFAAHTPFCSGFVRRKSPTGKKKKKKNSCRFWSHFHNFHLEMAEWAALMTAGHIWLQLTSSFAE